MKKIFIGTIIIAAGLAAGTAVRLYQPGRFIWNAYHNDLAAADHMVIKEGISPDIRLGGYNAIAWILNGSQEPELVTIDYLLKVGTNSECRSANGTTNVSRALKRNRADIAAILLKYGATITPEEKKLMVKLEANANKK